MEGSSARIYHTKTSEPPDKSVLSAEVAREEVLSRYTVSFGLSAAITSILSALLVVIKELNETTILEWMKHATPHHWITHGIFNLVVFVVLGFGLARVNGGNGLAISSKMLSRLIVGAVAVSCIVIAGFYIIMG